MAVQLVDLHRATTLKWTTAQENTLSRDYPFREHEFADPALFVQRTYLHFLWLPQSIMPLSFFIPSLFRIRPSSGSTEDQPHPLHAFIEPLLLSLRAAANKYHNELPQILVDGGGAGEAEESMMWYALGYEKTPDTSLEESKPLNIEDSVMLEDKWRSSWLERMEQREVQVQILLYFLKLSLPGPCTPLPPVEMPHTGGVSSISPIKPIRLRKGKKEEPHIIVPSPLERLESFMDKLSMWQLVYLTNTSRTEPTQANGQKDERDWMQKFCEDVVEPLFKSKLPEQCTLLRSKLFPNSPFSDVPPSPGPSRGKSLSSSRTHHPSTDISRSTMGSQSLATIDALPRSRSLSVSLAEEKEKERAASVNVIQDKTLQRALTRQISMSRAWKGKGSTTVASQIDTKAAATAKDIRRAGSQLQSSQPRTALAVTLVTATPIKKPPLRLGAESRTSTRSSSPIDSVHARKNSNSSLYFTGRSSSPLTARSSSITPLDTDSDYSGPSSHDLHDCLDSTREQDEEKDEELWSRNSSPDVLLLGSNGWGTGRRKRVPSEVSEAAASSTPVRKRMKFER